MFMDFVAVQVVTIWRHSYVCSNFEAFCLSLKCSFLPKACNTQNKTKDKSIKSIWLWNFYSLGTFILFLLWFLKPSETLDYLLKDNYIRTARIITQTHHRSIHYEHLCTLLSEDLVIFPLLVSKKSNELFMFIFIVRSQ